MFLIHFWWLLDGVEAELATPRHAVDATPYKTVSASQPPIRLMPPYGPSFARDLSS